MRCLICVTLLSATLVATSGCGRDGADDAKGQRPRFAFVINVPGRYWDIAHAGCLKAAEEENVEVEFHVPGESTAAQQKQIVESLISKGVAGLAITPLNPQSMGRVLDQAAGFMPVICMDSDAPDCKRVCYIGTDNVEAGRRLGEQMKKALPDGGEVAMFVGQLDVGNARDRHRGVTEALAGSNLTVIGTFTDGADRPTARSNVADVLAKHPNLKGVIGLWGYNGPAAAKALEDNPEREVKIIAADEDVETLYALRQGRIYASVAQQPFEFGYQSIKMLARLHRKESVDIPDDKLIYVPTYVITQDDVDEVAGTVDAKLELLAQHRTRQGL
jgi:ribose transport system substrate-binding protein